MFVSIEVPDFEEFALYEKVTSSEVRAYKKNEEKMLNELTEYFLDDENTLDGDAIQSHLFPEDDIDIFLSHSHADVDEVIELAIALEKQGLKVFVDSCVWGNAFELLKVIDDKYCRNSNNRNYSYDRRNLSTSHAYMMLNTALHKMIDRCEVLLFLGTPNSVTIRDGLNDQDTLMSPWILSELAFIQHVRRKSKFKQPLTESLESVAVFDNLQFAYSKPDLDVKIYIGDLENILEEKFLKKEEFFEALYAVVQKEELTNIDGAWQLK